MYIWLCIHVYLKMYIYIYMCLIMYTWIFTNALVMKYSGIHVKINVWIYTFEHISMIWWFLIHMGKSFHYITKYICWYPHQINKLKSIIYTLLQSIHWKFEMYFRNNPKTRIWMIQSFWVFRHNESLPHTCDVFSRAPHVSYSQNCKNVLFDTYHCWTPIVYTKMSFYNFILYLIRTRHFPMQHIGAEG